MEVQSLKERLKNHKITTMGLGLFLGCHRSGLLSNFSRLWRLLEAVSGKGFEVKWAGFAQLYSFFYMKNSWPTKRLRDTASFHNPIVDSLTDGGQLLFLWLDDQLRLP